ncbi:hypothetical protein HYX03_02880 [Candidatus Woesearchaeota archaeon]|nr:hypothetical protein [Candidatus Woesearchaeota archaeon]
MNKMLLSVFILLLISIAACQQAAKEPVMEKKEDVMQKTETPTAATGDAAVDAVGKDLNNVDTVEKDLSVDELSDLDAGLADIQNI